MYPPQAGSDHDGNVFIPFIGTQADMPFKNWNMVTKKVFQSEGPVVIQSVIITSNGEVFIQYATEVHDTNEFPKQESLIYSEEKRSYQ